MDVDKNTANIRRFILEQARSPAQGLGSRVAAQFGISRQAVSRHIHVLEAEGCLSGEKEGRARIWHLAARKQAEWQYPLVGLREDVVWRECIVPLVAPLPENVRDMLHYGFTEMVNNAIDHSDGKTLTIHFAQTALDIEIRINDDGEGIFHRIQRLLDLYDAREAILELSKGKLTTDPVHHSGEGIFFTSRMFDAFSIRSRGLDFSHCTDKEDWLVDGAENLPGTQIRLQLANDASRAVQEVFDRFAQPDEFTFSKTIVPVRLAAHEGEKLVSRSQAKRLVMRFERFKTVILDFKGVEEIGQAFADEVFRVFKLKNPDVELIPLNLSNTVAGMINRALAARG